MTMLDATPTPPTSLRIDPRLKQRWIDVRREEGRKRLRLLVAMAAGLALVAAGVGALYSPLLKVRHVRVALGSVPVGSGLTATQVEARAGLDRERLMVNVSPAAEARLIEQLPWVATARVEREWPATVRIAVTARRPVAEVDRIPGKPASGFAVLDATGRVLSLLPAGSASLGSTSEPGSSRSASGSVGGSGAADLPLLRSLPAPGVPGTRIPAQGGIGGQIVAEELATAAALPPALDRRISSITIAKDGLELRIGPVVVLFGDGGELAPKVASLETVISKISLAGVGVVDLRVPDRPALTRAH